MCISRERAASLAGTDGQDEMMEPEKTSVLIQCVCVCVCLQCHPRALPAAAPLAAALLFLAVSSDGGEDAAEAAAQSLNTRTRHTLVFDSLLFSLDVAQAE